MPVGFCAVEDEGSPPMKDQLQDVGQNFVESKKLIDSPAVRFILLAAKSGSGAIISQSVLKVTDAPYAVPVVFVA